MDPGSDVHFHAAAASFNLGAGCARRCLTVCLDVGNISLHFSDFAALRRDDCICQCPNPWVQNICPLTGQDGDGMVWDHRPHPREVVDRLLASDKPGDRAKVTTAPAKIARLTLLLEQGNRVWVCHVASRVKIIET